MASTSSPPASNQSYNAPAVVSIVTWFLLTSSILSVVARSATKLALRRKLYQDDIVIFTALLFSVGQSVAVSVAASNGLSKNVDDLQFVEVGRYQKAAYAANIFFILTMSFAKLSIVLLIKMITPVKIHRTLAMSVGIATVCWAVSAVIGFVFQCRLPQPWNTMQLECMDINSFWYFVDIFNILTDLALVLIPMRIAWQLKASFRRRFVIFSCFAIRLFVVAAIIVQIYYQTLTDRTNPTATDWPAILLSQIVQNLSIITACVPYLKPLFESLESGMIRSDDLRRRAPKGSQYASDSHQLDLSGGHSTKRNQFRQEIDNNNVVHVGPGQACAHVSVGNNEIYGWDEESQASSSRMIKETRTWAVE